MKLKLIQKNPPITLNELNNFEEEFKIKLHKEYKNFLLKNNGGKPEININIFYKTKDLFNSEIYVSNFLKLEEVANFIRCKDTTESINMCYKNGTIIIAENDTQEISIGFRKNNFGKIFNSIYMESIEIQFLASSFNKFINNFQKRECFIDNRGPNQVDEVHWFTKYLMEN